jgi:hypothetical protein
MDAAAANPASSSLEAVATAFRSRVNELQGLALARNSELSPQPIPETLASWALTPYLTRTQCTRRRR